MAQTDLRRADRSLPNVFGMDRDDLEALVRRLEEPPYRVAQLFRWLYAKRARCFDEMTNLGRPLRARLAALVELRWPELIERTCSSDGTVKYLFRLRDGATIETVFIPEATRRTLCLSTQAGCPLRCAFCLTGIAGYTRNLRVSEILGQVAFVMREHESDPRSEVDGHAAPRRGWNVVVMGMGEPLLNADATIASLRILMDRDGFAITPKKLTLSTVGILPALEKLMQEPIRPNLAISLHAPNPVLRRALMPIEEKYRLEDVVAAAQRYPIPRGGQVTYEYVLLGGVNDGLEQARQLARLLRGSRCKVNLIPLNPAPEIPFEPPSREAVDRFCRILSEHRVMASVRRPRGQDILAACGQLHLKQTRAPQVETAIEPPVTETNLPKGPSGFRL